MKKTQEIVPRETTTEIKVEKKAEVVVYEDGYVIISMMNDGKTERKKSALKVGDRLKNAIKAMAKEGYIIKIHRIEQTELPFTENEKTV